MLSYQSVISLLDHYPMCVCARVFDRDNDGKFAGMACEFWLYMGVVCGTLHLGAYVTEPPNQGYLIMCFFFFIVQRLC